MFHNKLAFIYYIYRKRVNLLYNYVIYYNEFRIKQILLTIVLIISNMTGRNQ